MYPLRFKMVGVPQPGRDPDNHLSYGHLRCNAPQRLANPGERTHAVSNVLLPALRSAGRAEPGGARGLGGSLRAPVWQRPLAGVPGGAVTAPVVKGCRS